MIVPGSRRKQRKPSSERACTKDSSSTVQWKVGYPFHAIDCWAGRSCRVVTMCLCLSATDGRNIARIGCRISPGRARWHVVLVISRRSHQTCSRHRVLFPHAIILKYILRPVVINHFPSTQHMYIHHFWVHFHCRRYQKIVPRRSVCTRKQPHHDRRMFTSQL